MLVQRISGALSAITALVAAYWGVRAMFTLGPEGPLFWLPMVAFGAPVLLLVGGVLALAPHLRKGWLLGLAGFVFVAFWAIFLRELGKSYWVFATLTMLLTWAGLSWASAIGRPAIVALLASVTLIIIWLPVATNLLRSLTVPALAANAPLLGLWILDVGTAVISAFATLHPQKA